jgi:hypothetical protein
MQVLSSHTDIRNMRLCRGPYAVICKHMLHATCNLETEADPTPPPPAYLTFNESRSIPVMQVLSSHTDIRNMRLSRKAYLGQSRSSPSAASAADTVRLCL